MDLKRNFGEVTTPAAIKAMEFLQQQLAQINVEVEVVPMEVRYTYQIKYGLFKTQRMLKLKCIMVDGLLPLVMQTGVFVHYLADPMRSLHNHTTSRTTRI